MPIANIFARQDCGPAQPAPSASELRAVAALVGKTPRNVMQGLKRGWRYSRVVNKEDGEPSEYHDLQKHPALRERPEILKTGEALAAWLSNPT
jgi:arsenate reductase-like glutaredoxin family protein